MDGTQEEWNESRRRFLRQAMLAGVGLTAAPLLLTPQPAEAFDLVAAPSPADQKKIGEQAAQQTLQKYPEIHDSRATHFQNLGQRLVSALPSYDRQTWDYRFHVLDSKEINAFALPGGPMFMFTGLYEKLTTDDAMAAVTGHEMTHVRAQHWAKAYAKQQERQVGLSILLTILKAGKTAQSLAGLADNAISLRFSRTEEDQADAGGLNNMVAAGYNPIGMLQLFQTLQKISGNGDMFGTDILSNHPLTSARIRNAQSRIAILQRSHSFPPVTPLHYASLIR